MDFAPNSLVAVHRPGTSEHDGIAYNINEVEIIPDGDNARIEFAKAAMQSLIYVVGWQMTDLRNARLKSLTL